MSKPLPKIPGIKPKRPQHDLDRLINALEDARPLYERIRKHSADFHARITDKQAKTHPGGPGTSLRDFTPINPLDEWMAIGTEPGLQVSTLEKQGLIAVLEIEGKWMARPGAAA